MYWIDDRRQDVNDKDMQSNLKWAATKLDYHGQKSIPVKLVDTHSLQIGGANALLLSGYSDMDIQKWGNGVEQRSNNILGNNCQLFWKGCHKR